MILKWEKFNIDENLIETCDLLVMLEQTVFSKQSQWLKGIHLPYMSLILISLGKSKFMMYKNLSIFCT